MEVNKKNIVTRILNRLLYTKEIYENAFFDWYLNIATSFVKETKDYHNNPALLKHAVRYQASGYRPTRKALKYVRRNYNCPTLIDLGCGAGRVLVLADKYGFTTAVGIEIDKELAELARSNFSRYAQRHGAHAECLVENQSVSDFVLPVDHGVIFLFHPFDSYVLEQFMENNLRHFQNGDFVFVYSNPRLHTVLDAYGFEVAHEWGNKDYNRIVRIYTNKNR